MVCEEIAARHHERRHADATVTDLDIASLHVAHASDSGARDALCSTSRDRCRRERQKRLAPRVPVESARKSNARPLTDDDAPTMADLSICGTCRVPRNRPTPRRRSR